MKSALRLLPLYIGVFTNAILTVIAIPVMIRSAGLDGWASIGVGQTVGTVIAPLVGFGWAVTGPAAVARASLTMRLRIYRESVCLRMVGVVPSIGVGTLITMAISSSDDAGASLVGVVSAALVAMDASFYFLGTGELWKQLLITTLPRSVGTALGLVSVSILSAPAVWIPLGTILGTGVSLIISHIYITRGSSKLREPRTSARRLIKSQWLPVVSSLSGSIFLLIPTALVGTLNHSELSAFVLFDRITKQALTATSPIFTHFQGWVPRGTTTAERNTRMRKAFLMTLLTCTVILLGFLTLGAWAVDIVSAGALKGDIVLSFAMGALVTLSLYEALISRVALIVVDKVKEMTVITLAGVLVGALCVWALTDTMGALGALLGICIGMAVRSILGTLTYASSRIR